MVVYYILSETNYNLQEAYKLFSFSITNSWMGDGENPDQTRQDQTRPDQTKGQFFENAIMRKKLV